MTTLQAIILGIIEGLTEFLPVSSTGHLILGSSLMGLKSDSFLKLFTVAIQLGTILSVVVLYFKRFFKSIDFYYKLVVAAIPAVILGVLFSKKIDAMLESPMTVAISLVVGGIVLLFIEKVLNKPDTTITADNVPYKNAFIIGLFQCLALIPGMSRSAATIIGGMQQKLTKKAAAEFSFFLAVPMMFGATAKELLSFVKDGGHLSGEEIKLLTIGNIVGFIVAIIAIKSFIAFVSKKGFAAFGVYRIIVGGIILAILLSGHSLSMV